MRLPVYWPRVGYVAYYRLSLESSERVHSSLRPPVLQWRKGSLRIRKHDAMGYVVATKSVEYPTSPIPMPLVFNLSVLMKVPQGFLRMII